MKTPKHTKTPWMIAYGGEEGDGYAVIASKFSDRPVCTIEPRDFNTANAALIVRAVNAHEQMVGALESVAQAFAVEHIAEVIPPSVMAKVKAALRAAKEKS